MVVHILSRQYGGAGWAAHGRGGEGVGEMRAALLHDVPSFVHGLHRAWGKTVRERGEEGEVVRGIRRVRGDSKDKE